MANDLTTPGNPMEEFQKRVLEKLKTDIGSLMPEEALAKLVERAVEDAFFKKPTRTDGYGRVTESGEPSWFQKALVEAVKPMLEASVKQAVIDNKAEIDAAVKGAFEKDKLILAVAAATGEAVRAGVTQAGFDLFNQLRNNGFIRGY